MTGADGFAAEGSSGGSPNFRLLSACEEIKQLLNQLAYSDKTSIVQK